MKHFVSNDYPSLGVEEEYHLIDPESGDLVSRVEDIFEVLDAEQKQTTCYELFLAILESRSAVCRSVDELVEDVQYRRQSMADTCKPLGIMIAASGSHPYADWQKLKMVPGEHYQWVVNKCDYIARRMLAFGLHIHVGMRSIESAMYALYEMRRWVYPLMGMSANSPYYGGIKTGFASTRAHLFSCMPGTEMTPYFEDWSELEDYFEKMKLTGDMRKPADILWSMRPQPPLGTVEVRVFDLPTDVKRLGALVAVVQAGLVYYQDRYYAGEAATEMKTYYFQQNFWKALRHGISEQIIDAATEEVTSTREFLSQFFDLIEKKVEQLGSTRWLNLAREMLETGTESDWQVQTYNEMGNDFKKLEFEIARRTLR
ncbi:MAG: YbdK family carboxylate-amine ligase [Planctomycetes bacterium]|nr:YbdK family carboxylate-amine ligase [Planctomycetota bacterium]